MCIRDSVVAASKQIIISIICASAALQACNVQPSYDFGPDIAKCQAMEDVNVILEGQFRKASQRSAKFDAIKEKRDNVKIAKQVYDFKVSRLHKGNSGITDNRTGKQILPDYMVIREGEAPEGAVGKKAIICYTGKPQKIKSIHIAK